MYLALFRPQNEASGPDQRLEELLFRLMMSDRTGIIMGIGNEPVSPPQRSTGCRVENSNCDKLWTHYILISNWGRDIAVCFRSF